jgi:thiamine biosynthesis lipoprotein
VSEHDLVFSAMGCELRMIVGSPLTPGLPPAHVAAQRARERLEELDLKLSRFRSDSELTRLNDDRRATVPASPLLRRAVAAGLWAAEQTGGLVDPTLVGEIERVGYTTSRAGVGNASLLDALANAPARRAARPHPVASWRQIIVDDRAGTITRPPGVRFDTGGTGKGLAADLIAETLAGYTRFVVDAAGDLRIGGAIAGSYPYEVVVEHPFRAAALGTVKVGTGAIATSGISSRIWQTANGYAHHLLDPATGEPAWTGLVSVTALARTALEAETLAKHALLGGPVAARAVLSRHGGIAVRDDGEVEWLGGLRPAPPRFRVSLPTGAAALAPWSGAAS